MENYARNLDAFSLGDCSLRDAVAGVHVFGGVGAGKTSTSGRMLAEAFLRTAKEQGNLYDDARALKQDPRAATCLRSALEE